MGIVVINVILINFSSGGTILILLLVLVLILVLILGWSSLE